MGVCESVKLGIYIVIIIKNIYIKQQLSYRLAIILGFTKTL